MKNERLTTVIKELGEIVFEVEIAIADNLIDLETYSADQHLIKMYRIKDAELCSMADAIDTALSILKDAIE